MNHLRKTHPMVLIAAIALTIFSLVGSAAITGLIPSAPHAEVQHRTMPVSNESGTSTSQGQYDKETTDHFYQGIQQGPSRAVMVRA